jgi:hypothetical protein
MRRVSFYFLVALLAFGIGSFITIAFHWLNDDKPQTAKNQANFSSKFEPVQSYSIKETDEMLSKTTSQKRVKENPYCSEAKILPLWNELIKDKDFQSWWKDSVNSLDCVEMFEIKEVDLNIDGRKEILLRGKNMNLCDAVGNCGFWIYEKKGDKYKKLLSSTDYIDITKIGNQVRKAKTNNYSNILLKGHLSGVDTEYTSYKFDGQEYKKTKCLVHTYVPGTMDNPKHEFISCREWEKRDNF